MMGMILLIVGAGLCLSYFLVYAVFQIFFPGRMDHPAPIQVVRSILLITLLVTATFLASFLPTDPHLGNRLLHGLGGGLTVFFVCFRVVKDGNFKVNRLQFFILSLLLVTALGVGNEIIELGLQRYLDITMAKNVSDTWFDLVSNTTGAILAGTIITPFVKEGK